MANKSLIIGSTAILGALAVLLLPRRAFGFASLTAAGIGGFSVSDLPLPQALAPREVKTNKQRAYETAVRLNNTRFNGWFSDTKHNLDDVMNVWRVESNYKPDALRFDDGGVGNHAYGIGQVLGSTSGDFGITNPSLMLNLETGARVSMDYLKWSWGYLTKRLGREPTRREWLGAYNAGVGAVSKGRLPEVYLTKIFINQLGF